jgi:hypothetical protein
MTLDQMNLGPENIPNVEPVDSIRPDEVEVERRREKKSIGDCAKIIIAGPPHSGKSVAERYIRHNLPALDVMRIASQPDGEGDWFHSLHEVGSQEVASRYRNKRGFSSENVAHWTSLITNSSNRFNLIDVGGEVSSENKEICDLANSIIIISSNPEETKKWIELAQETNLNILAILESTLDPERTERFIPTPDKEWENEGVVVGLERGKLISSSTLNSLVEFLLEKVPTQESKEIIEGYETLKTDYIATLIGKVPNEKTNRVDWSSEDIPLIYSSLQDIADRGGSFILQGPVPQFIAISILKALHPNKVALADSKQSDPETGKNGGVEIEPVELGELSAFGPLTWEVIDDFEGGSLVKYSSAISIGIKKSELKDIIPPVVDPTKPVFLSGQTANWVASHIALSYSSHVPAVFMFYPQIKGFVCCISNSDEFQLGEIKLALP